VRGLIHDRDHLVDCPNDGRVEFYPHRIPAKPNDGIPAEDVTVARCIECGGSSVVREPFGVVLARVEEDAADRLASEEVTA
jgi:hypothetical protein